MMFDLCKWPIFFANLLQVYITTAYHLQALGDNALAPSQASKVFCGKYVFIFNSHIKFCLGPRTGMDGLESVISSESMIFPDIDSVGTIDDKDSTLLVDNSDPSAITSIEKRAYSVNFIPKLFSNIQVQLCKYVIGFFAHYLIASVVVEMNFHKESCLH